MTKTTYETTIDYLDKKGSGRAVVWRDTGKENPKKLKLTIPQTIPNEKVQVHVDGEGKRWIKTDYTTLLEPSSERVTPDCPHFELCGGCVWQHWSYNGQLNEKTRYVKEMVKNNGFDPALVEETVGVEGEPYRYRNKMEFTFSKEGHLGLHEQGNFRKIIPLETCLIAGKEMVDYAMEVQQWASAFNLSGYDKDTHEGLLRHLMVRQSFYTGEVMLGLFAAEAPTGALTEAKEALIKRIEEKCPNVKSLMWFENKDWGDRTQAEEQYILSGRDFIYDEMFGFKYRLWFDTFFQTNPKQAETLVNLAIEMAQPKQTEKMIDLFCGVGTFSLPFAEKVGELAGIEIVETSIASAKRNALDNGIHNTTFLAKDARHGIDQMLTSFGIPELLLLDPPRSGAGGKVMRRIGRAKPERIVYVSCNPETFASDIKELVPFGYELVRVQPVDMFPHTPHVELVALMSRVDE
ncbi:23S rRNA (uracil-C(5))-methyltransferase RlmCD [Halolactibacillus alkaliphilus]|uniref:23S rRNA (Uracil-C(5))-methyltransferase RlmCD n=1 Tax=Halolactibacillus alkaliphilus TaxID=442899 RepID=A0A511X4U6_9BACI|nr:23S rRNA (uracil(1939)-C(5))-methyltransferase RlmD [Halolactibacillus alkaliphilus]GEN57963.1 23S rRNA (uracil-C(5))-methyltransferase RlmCD [Halolactibacillus alkaliphilus]GGN66108.1 23S rRNA (uracil-C(5))-methyltransferase RlmCD [Halolactibacillus alkaliphilus]SFO67162.1 23S rRNA (uracil1939-C5)-methyltransferase [Halolactibacillus alkaliphilus]